MPPDSSGLVFRRNVTGAPLKLDARVEISKSLDSSADPRFLGRTGVVSGYVYDSPQEQFPHRPMVLVTVDGLGEELFFTEELCAVRAQSARPEAPRTARAR